jgi:hypothetical protein
MYKVKQHKTKILQTFGINSANFETRPAHCNGHKHFGF